MDFENYLRNKKIDPIAFQKAEPMVWHEFKLIFDQVHPDSFTAQKLFLINGIRRQYPLQEEPESTGGIAMRGETDEKAINPKSKFPVPPSEGGKVKPKVVPKVRIAPKIKKNE